MKITRVSLQSKLDEGYMSTVKSVHPVSIAVKHSLFYRRIRVDNYISSSNFDCNENGVIFIEEYVSIVRSVHPTSCPQTGDRTSPPEQLPPRTRTIPPPYIYTYTAVETGITIGTCCN